jgi:hypothetical protein
MHIDPRNAKALVTLLTTGRIFKDFEMSENSNLPTFGQSANRTREEQFVADVKDVHKSEASKVKVDCYFAGLSGISSSPAWTTPESTNIKWRFQCQGRPNHPRAIFYNAGH